MIHQNQGKRIRVIREKTNWVSPVLMQKKSIQKKRLKNMKRLSPSRKNYPRDQKKAEIFKKNIQDKQRNNLRF